MISIQEYNDLMKEWDVVIPPYNIFEVESLAKSEVFNWGHTFLKVSDVFDVTKGEKVAIAILDTAGSFANHQDLKANSLENYGRNFSNAETRDDVHGHGTHCAGIAAAVHGNGRGIVGTAPNAKLIPVKVLNDRGSGSYTWIAQGVRYIADIKDELKQKHGIDRVIISMSLGGSTGAKIMHDAVKYAMAKGVICIAAAGNSYRADRDTQGFPSRYEEVIAVGSVNKNSQPSRFSSQGPTVDVAVPGESIYSTHKNNGYAYLSGTSMATPFVAGLVALLLSDKPDLDVRSIEKLLETVATDIHTKGFDKRTGFGIPFAPDIISGETPEPPTDDPDDGNPPPDNPDPDPEPPTDDPDPDPSRPPKNKTRELVLEWSEEKDGVEWDFMWSPRTNSTDGSVNLIDLRDPVMVNSINPLNVRKLKVDKIVVRATTRDYSDTFAAKLKNQLKVYFGNRVIVGDSKFDAYDAAYWGRRFVEVVFEHSFKWKIQVDFLASYDKDGTYPISKSTRI